MFVILPGMTYMNARKWLSRWPIWGEAATDRYPFAEQLFGEGVPPHKQGGAGIRHPPSDAPRHPSICFIRFNTLKEVIHVATHQEAMNAANKKPSNRSAYEQHLVDQHKGNQAVRNADHEAKQTEKIYGK